MTRTTFIFIRHGEAAHNVAARLRGEGAYSDPTLENPPLNEYGCMQAHDARATLISHMPVDVIYCSPLKRCIQTLRLIYPDTEKLPVILEDALMEPQGRHICNRRASISSLSMPQSWDAGHIAEVNPYDGLDEGPESVSFMQRIIDMTEATIRKHKGGCILMVSHYQWIRMWFLIYKGVELHPGNCQVLVDTL